MNLYRSLESLPEMCRGGAVSIGNFDGVHRGHARLASRLKELAGQEDGPAVVFTFDPHPVRLLRPEKAPPPLTWTDRKAELLAELGIDAVVAYPTDLALLSLSPDEFFQQIVRESLGAKALVEGPNFQFGRGRGGDIRLLSELCRVAHIHLEVVEPITLGEELVSSSRVREAIAAGDVDSARRMLTQPYRIRGMVTHGAGRGGSIGFPTANLEAIDTLLPAPGVYAGIASFQEENSGAVRLAAAVNIGPNPTFGEQALKVEVHVLDFSGSLYGKPLEVDFLTRLRSVQPFESVAALQAQLARDCEAARAAALKGNA